MFSKLKTVISPAYLCIPGMVVLVFALHFLIDLIRSIVKKGRFGHGRIPVKRSEFFAWVLGKGENSAKMRSSNLRPWFLINMADQAAHVVCLRGVALLV